MSRHVLTVLIGVVCAGIGVYISTGNNDIHALWAQYLIAIQSVQQGAHATLIETVRQIQEEPYKASLTLIFLSFLYGVFHAAGPGHGKVVISTYLLSHKEELRRGVLLSFSSALVQGIVAVMLVTSATWLFDVSMKQTQLLVSDIEMASFVLISAAGLIIVFLQGRRLFHALGTGSHQQQFGDTDDNDHAHHCNHTRHLKADHGHSDGRMSSFMSIVLSVGIRPCTGAVIILLLANSLSLHIAGIASVFAMSVGTALTVSLIAVVAVYARNFAANILSVMPEHHHSASLVSPVFGIAGGILILLFGLSLFLSAFFAPSHPFA